MSTVIVEIDVAGLDIDNARDPTGQGWSNMISSLRQSAPEPDHFVGVFRRDESSPERLLLLLGAIPCGRWHTSPSNIA